MDFKISKDNIKRNLVNIMRKAGYKFQRKSEVDQLSFVKSLRGGRYPRFHIYIEKTKRDVKFNIHLDQRRTNYKGSHAHGAEYSGKKIEVEADRIKKILQLKETPNKKEF